MGLTEKAKKLAETAQSRLDEAQARGNAARAGEPADGPVVEYDQHGRPVAREELSTPPHGDAVAPGTPSDVHEQNPHADAQAESASPPHGDPLLDAARKAPAPPSAGGGMTSGDPLGG